MKHACSICSLVFVLAGLAGCATSGEKKPAYSAITPHPSVLTNVPTVTVKTPLNPDLLRPESSPFTLGPGDSLDIEIVGTPTSRALTRVGPDGKIYYNLLPGLVYTDAWLG